MENQIMEALGLLLTTVITGGIGVITSYVAIYLNNLKIKIQAETAKIKNEDTRKLVDGALDRLNSLIITNVQSANETLVKTIKENAENGYSKEDLLAVRDVVRDNILKQLSSDSKELLAHEISNLDSFVENKIEEVLKQLKEGLIV